MFDQRLLGKTCTVIVVTLLYVCQISVLNALSWDYIKYKLKRSNADSFHHHLAYLPNRKLYPNIRCRCGLDTVRNAIRISVWEMPSEYRYWKRLQNIGIENAFRISVWEMPSEYRYEKCLQNIGIENAFKISVLKMPSEYRYEKCLHNIGMRNAFKISVLKMPSKYRYWKCLQNIGIRNTFRITSVWCIRNGSIQDNIGKTDIISCVNCHQN